MDLRGKILANKGRSAFNNSEDGYFNLRPGHMLAENKALINVPPGTLLPNLNVSPGTVAASVSVARTTTARTATSTRRRLSTLTTASAPSTS